MSIKHLISVVSVNLKQIKVIIAFCFYCIANPAYSAVFVEVGDLQTLDTTIVNANSGQIVAVTGDYYVLSGSLVGTEAEEDILLNTTHDQFAVWEDGGAFSFESIGVILTAAGNDIFDLSRITDSVLAQMAEGDDLIWTGSGDDTIGGNQGNDIIDGGLGIDTVTFQGILTDYSIVQLIDGTYQVTGITDTLQGTDTISNVELASFSTQTSNTTYNLADIAVSAVPIPPAVWLFGSGVIGLIGIAKRKKSA